MHDSLIDRIVEVKAQHNEKLRSWHKIWCDQLAVHNMLSHHQFFSTAYRMTRIEQQMSKMQIHGND